MTRWAVLLAVGLLVPAFAGCAEKGETDGALSQGQTGAPFAGSSAPKPQPVTAKGTSERWHFHDYWQGHPTITLAQVEITLEPGLNDDGVPVYGHIMEFPRGTLVPPETGFLTITVNWTTPEPGPVNLTYRPADSNDFLPFADAELGVPLTLFTSESNADVPHRQESWWRFNFSAPAAIDPESARPARAPPRVLNVTIEATIGRPLFIDPPHLNWWAAGQVIPLVSAASGEFASATTPASKNVTLPSIPPPTSPRAVSDNITVRVDEGRIVPEGAKSVVVLLNWTSTVPGTKLSLAYAEANYPSAGALDVVQDGAGSRVFVMPVTNGMTDTTYSNRTTWEFHVLPEGEATAFHGSFEMYAWVTKHDPADAVRYTLGGT